MLGYGDFYDIAEYGNANWKGGYTPKEKDLTRIFTEKQMEELREIQ